MKQRGFTLIELLVVVLIIGILAAIALPQYQKAVLKSRFSSLFPLGKALREGNEAYYLTQGNYSSNLSALDVTATGKASGSSTTLANGMVVTLGTDNQHRFVRVTRGDIANNVVMYQKHSQNFPDEIHCEAKQEHTLANWLCKESLKGIFVGSKTGYNVYTLGADFKGTLAKKYYNTNKLTLADGDQCIASRSYSCYNSKFSKGSMCVAKAGAYACGGGAFTNESVCFGETTGACSGPFDHSYCVAAANVAWSCCGTPCRGGTFTNHSVCYANSPSSCASSYDATSCCEGTYCPSKEVTCAYKGITAPPQPTY